MRSDGTPTTAAEADNLIRQNASRSVTIKLFDRTIFELLVPAIKRERSRVDALEKRIQELESRPSLKYCGVWLEGAYRPGDVVTEDGSMWHCNIATRSKPGQSKDWTLCVKRGREGRSGR